MKNYKDILKFQEEYGANNYEGIKTQIEYIERASEISKEYEEDRLLDLECTINNLRESLGLSIDDIDLLMNNKKFNKC